MLYCTANPTAVSSCFKTACYMITLCFQTASSSSWVSSTAHHISSYTCFTAAVLNPHNNMYKYQTGNGCVHMPRVSFKVWWEGGGASTNTKSAQWLQQITSAPTATAVSLQQYYIRNLSLHVETYRVELQGRCPVCRHWEYLGTCMLSRIHPARKVKC